MCTEGGHDGSGEVDGVEGHRAPSLVIGYLVGCIVCDANMENPYAATVTQEESATAVRTGRSVWKSLFIAYGVHHGFAVLGLFAGLALNPRLWSVVGDPCLTFFAFIAIPILDAYLVTEPTSPIVLHDRPRTGWLPAAVV